MRIFGVMTFWCNYYCSGVVRIAYSNWWRRLGFSAFAKIFMAVHCEWRSLRHFTSRSRERETKGQRASKDHQSPWYWVFSKSLMCSDGISDMRVWDAQVYRSVFRAPSIHVFRIVSMLLRFINSSGPFNSRATLFWIRYCSSKGFCSFFFSPLWGIKHEWNIYKKKINRKNDGILICAHIRSPAQNRQWKFATPQIEVWMLFTPPSRRWWGNGLLRTR